jgi:hypothetical protein
MKTGASTRPPTHSVPRGVPVLPLDLVCGRFAERGFVGDLRFEGFRFFMLPPARSCAGGGCQDRSLTSMGAGRVEMIIEIKRATAVSLRDMMERLAVTHDTSYRPHSSS